MKSEKLACSFTPARVSLFHRFTAKTGERFFFACLLLAFATGLSVPSPARADDDQQGIAAVVNDHLISRYDLDQRLKLIMSTSGIEDTPESRKRIEPQILRALIDETLELQEAKRQGVKSEQKDIDEQLENIAKRAGMTTAQIDEFLKKNGVSKDSLVNQIKADIVWNRVVSQQFGPLITVSDEEVNNVIERLKTEADQPRYLLSEIMLTFDNEQQEREMTDGATRLAEQIRTGVNFADVARQFSRAPTARNGGDMGWVYLSQVAPQIGDVVKDMGIGAVSEPIKTLNGVYLVELRNKQTAAGTDPMKDEWTLIKVILPLTKDAPAAAIERRVTEAKTFQAGFKTCDQIPTLIKPFIGAEAEAPQTVVFGNLPPPMKEIFSKSKPGDILPPRRGDQGIELVAICDHKVNSAEMPSREDIQNNLENQQLSMMARRYLRDLRRDAVIEIR
ncbi:MAG: peptidylprolyl isomerase [Parvibaculaceae bacterium]